MMHFTVNLNWSIEKPLDLREELAAIEKCVIILTLGNQKTKAQTAKLLRLNRTTLVEKMRRYDLQREEPTRRKKRC